MNKVDYIMKLIKHPSAWIGHAKFAMDLVELIKPKNVVDLGVDFGFSTFCFAYHNIGNVWGIDWFEGDDHAGKRNTLPIVENIYEELQKESGINNITFVKSNFHDASLKWSKPNIEILHIDGFHSYEAVSKDFNDWSIHCNDDSIILFHDVESFPLTVGKFFGELEGYKLIKSGSAGLGIYTKSLEKHELVKSIL